jgi:hypothetical protein
MEIKTKYSVGEIVYYLSEDDQVYSAETGKVKIVEGMIIGVQTDSWRTGSKVVYKLQVGQKNIVINEEFVDKDVRKLFQTVLQNSDENYRIKLDK